MWRKISPGQKKNCRSYLGITGRYSVLLGTVRTSGLLGLYQPLSSLDNSIVYLKCNLHLWLLKHKVSQVVCVSLWKREREKGCAYAGLYQEWLGWIPKSMEPVTLLRGTLCSPLALGDLETSTDPVQFYGADQMLGSALILFHCGADWVFLGEASFNCWALAGIQWQD